MGPHPFRRGKGHVPTRVSEHFFELQWGHTLSGVESIDPIETMQPTIRLQWGHTLSGVERRGPAGGCRNTGRCNGATPFQAWKGLSATI